MINTSHMRPDEIRAAIDFESRRAATTQRARELRQIKIAADRASEEHQAMIRKLFRSGTLTHS